LTGSVWTDLLLFAAFITLLSIGMFRLDTIISSSRPKSGQSPKQQHDKFCVPDKSGKIILLDPDGRRARRPVRR